MNKQIILFFLLILGTNLSFATPNGYYLSSGLGYAQINTNGSINGLNPSSSSVGGIGYRLAGGYQFTLNHQWLIGPEISYRSLPTNIYNYPESSNLGTIDVSGYQVEFILRSQYYFQPTYYFLGSIGAAMNKQSLYISSTTGNQSVSKSQTLPDLIIGIGHDLTPSFSMSLSYNTTLGGTSTLTNDSGYSNNAASSYAVFLNLTSIFGK